MQTFDEHVTQFSFKRVDGWNITNLYTCKFLHYGYFMSAYQLLNPQIFRKLNLPNFILHIHSWQILPHYATLHQLCHVSITWVCNRTSSVAQEHHRNWKVQILLCLSEFSLAHDRSLWLMSVKVGCKTVLSVHFSSRIYINRWSYCFSEYNYTILNYNCPAISYRCWVTLYQGLWLSQFELIACAD